MRNKQREQKEAVPVWFRILVPVFSGVILLGAIYAMLAGKILPGGNQTAGQNAYLFETQFLIFADKISETSEPEIAVQIQYDSVNQIIRVSPWAAPNGKSYREQNYVCLSAGDFQAIIDKAGGIPWQENGQSRTLNGAQAYSYAAGKDGTAEGKTLFRQQAELVAAFLSEMRTHSGDAAFMLKLFAYASPKIETNLKLKTLASVGKNVLKADTVDVEVLGE